MYEDLHDQEKYAINYANEVQTTRDHPLFFIDVIHLSGYENKAGICTGTRTG